MQVPVTIDESAVQGEIDRINANGNALTVRTYAQMILDGNSAMLVAQGVEGKLAWVREAVAADPSKADAVLAAAGVGKGDVITVAAGGARG